MSKFTNMTTILYLALSQLVFSCARIDSSNGKDGQDEELPTGRFRVEIVIPNAPDDMTKLLGVFGNQNYLVDSAKGDSNGLFIFEADTLLQAGFYYVMLSSDNSYFQLLLDKDQEFRLETSKGDLVKAMKVGGDLDNELLYKNLKFEAEFETRLKPVNDQLAAVVKGTEAYNSVKAKQDALVKERMDHIQWFAQNHPGSFFTKFKISGQNPELTYPKLPNGQLDQVTQVYRYRKAFFDNVDFNASSTIRTPVFANKLRTYIRDLTPQHADSLIRYADELISKTKSNKELFKFVVNWIALEYKTPKTMGTEALYVHMIDTYWTPELAYWSNPEEIKGLRGEVSLMKPSLIGKIGQDIQAINEKGETISLYGLRSPIKVLYIYSYDCEHCQKETPQMVQVYNQWKNQGLDVFALSTDTDKSKWLEFIRKNNMTFQNALDPEKKSRYERKYHIDITPELYVLDRNNKIIASNLSPEQLPDFLKAERARNPW